jgi:hypothetical protein
MPLCTSVAPQPNLLESRHELERSKACCPPNAEIGQLMQWVPKIPNPMKDEEMITHARQLEKRNGMKSAEW